MEGMEGRCCWWWEEENLVFQRILCSLHLSMPVHHHLTLTLTEQILFSGWIHTHKWFSSETYSLASILGSLITCCFGALVFCQTWHWSRIMQHMYGTDDNAEPIDCLVFSIKRTPYQFFLQLELFGDRLKRIETCRGKWRHGR